MHEASIAKGIMDVALQEKATRKLDHIRKIGVRIGQLSDVVPEALEFAFENLKKETELASTVLVIEHVPIEATCNACNNTFAVEDEIFVCPKCKSNKVSLQTGEELEVIYIEP